MPAINPAAVDLERLLAVCRTYLETRDEMERLFTRDEADLPAYSELLNHAVAVRAEMRTLVKELSE